VKRFSLNNHNFFYFILVNIPKSSRKTPIAASVPLKEKAVTGSKKKIAANDGRPCTSASRIPMAKLGSQLKKPAAKSLQFNHVSNTLVSPVYSHIVIRNM